MVAALQQALLLVEWTRCACVGLSCGAVQWWCSGGGVSCVVNWGNDVLGCRDPLATVCVHQMDGLADSKPACVVLVPHTDGGPCEAWQDKSNGVGQCCHRWPLTVLTARLWCTRTMAVGCSTTTISASISISIGSARCVW